MIIVVQTELSIKFIPIYNLTLHMTMTFNCWAVSFSESKMYFFLATKTSTEISTRGTNPYDYSKKGKDIGTRLLMMLL